MHIGPVRIVHNYYMHASIYSYEDPNGNPNNEIIRDISNLGTDELRLIHSPEFLTRERSAAALILMQRVIEQHEPEVASNIPRLLPMLC